MRNLLSPFRIPSVSMISVATSALLLAFLVAAIGCSKKPEAPLGGEGSAATELKGVSQPAGQNPTRSATSAQVSPGTSKCADGSFSTELRGKCSGTWRVSPSRAAGKSPQPKPEMICEYVWRAVSCETMGYLQGPPNTCYGVYAAQPDAAIHTDADCAKKFGDPPQSVDFTLQCCKK